MYAAGVQFYFLLIDAMSWWMMAACGHAGTQPYGGIVPFGTTKTGRNRIQHLLAEFKIAHLKSL
jgi:hypothetical protein